MKLLIIKDNAIAISNMINFPFKLPFKKSMPMIIPMINIGEKINATILTFLIFIDFKKYQY